MTDPRALAHSSLLLALLLAAPTLSAQRQFAESTKAHFPATRTLARGVAAGDIDGDGDLDVFLAVSAFANGPSSRLYRNDGGHSFTDVSATHLPAGLFQQNSAVFGDVDGDGDLDLVIADTWQDRLYLNDGAGHFSDATFGRLPKDLVDTRRLLLADLDGDGDLDLVRVTYGPPTIYLNNGAGVFTDVSATHVPPFPPSGAWDVAAADIDGDHDLDIAISAQNTQVLWLNDGTGRFTDVTGTMLPVVSVNGAGVAFCDVDHDHDLDLVFANWKAAPTLYLNDGTGHFADATAGRMPPLADNVWDLDVGDVDGDNDVDIVFAVAGQNRLYVNDGTGTFTDVTATRMPARTDAAIQVVLRDLDGDGDLDLVFANTWQESRLCYNDGGRFVDASPTRYKGLVGATYALALGDVDGDGDLDVVLGEGQSGEFTETSRLLLNDGNGFVGPAPAGSFPVDYTIDTRAVVLGDVDGDGDLDVVLGNNGASPRLYLNTGGGVFVDATSRLPASAAATFALALGDVDGDGDLDLVLGDFGTQSRLFLNDGAGNFADATAGRLPALVLDTRAVKLVDVDKDGDLDLVLANGLATGQQNRLYLNDGAGHFTDVTATHMPAEAVATACLAAGDVDGDGDVDLVLGNDSPTFGWRNSLYLNDGSGHFTDASARMVYDFFRTFAIELADVDEDGDLDIVCGDNNHWNKLYLNDGTGSFSDDSPSRMPMDYEDTSALAVGDMDGDGDLDLVVAGNGWTRAVETVQINHHRQIWSKRLAHVGETYVLDVQSRPGYATAPQIALSLLGVGTANIPLPPFGTLRVNPSGMVILPALALPAPLGVASLAVPIPADNALVGLHVYFQSLVISGAEARFTNLLDERIGGF